VIDPGRGDSGKLRKPPPWVHPRTTLTILSKRCTGRAEALGRARVEAPSASGSAGDPSTATRLGRTAPVLSPGQAHSSVPERSLGPDTPLPGCGFLAIGSNQIKSPCQAVTDAMN
jgi:hypothetical protein